MEAVVRYAPISMVPTPAPVEEATCSTQMERHAQVGVILTGDLETVTTVQNSIVLAHSTYCETLDQDRFFGFGII